MLPSYFFILCRDNRCVCRAHSFSVNRKVRQEDDEVEEDEEVDWTSEFKVKYRGIGIGIPIGESRSVTVSESRESNEPGACECVS